MTPEEDASCADLSLPMGKRKAETLSPANSVDGEGCENDEEIEEKGSTESDQVWGVDSFDSGWESSDEEAPPVDDEEELEFRRYLRHIYKSKGFLLDKEMIPKNLFQGFRRLSLDTFFKRPDLTGRDYMKIMAQVAVDKYNQTENKTLTIDNIVRAVVRMSSGVKAYITFMAKESPGGQLVEYQAKTEKHVWQSKIHPILCRPAPKGDLTPSGKGWGLRTLERLPKEAFVCEYIGEILTIAEDAHWGSEESLDDNKALCLDGSHYGNISRFL